MKWAPMYKEYEKWMRSPMLTSRKIFEKRRLMVTVNDVASAEHLFGINAVGDGDFKSKTQKYTHNQPSKNESDALRFLLDVAHRFYIVLQRQP